MTYENINSGGVKKTRGMLETTCKEKRKAKREQNYITTLIYVTPAYCTKFWSIARIKANTVVPKEAAHLIKGTKQLLRMGCLNRLGFRNLKKVRRKG